MTMSTVPAAQGKLASPDPDWLDSQYNNRLRVPEFPAILARWQARSEAALKTPGLHLDLAYGSGASDKLDIYPTADAKPAPVAVFIHGGYWRSLSKADHAFVGTGLANIHGGPAPQVCAVVIDYDLCPGSPDAPVTVPDIALQGARALAWVWQHIHRFGGDPRRIQVIGHSAGGHLAAMMMACGWQGLGKALGVALPADLVRQGISISGLHELESIRQCPYLQTSLQLTPTDALRASPAWMPPPRFSKAQSLLAFCGGDESEEFHRHTQLIQQRWGKGRVPVAQALPGLNHFTVLESMLEPRTVLNGWARRLLAC
jgi:arylformamidase